MSIASHLVITFLSIASIHLGMADEDEKKDPNTIFDSETDSAHFATITGAWRAYEFQDLKMIRLTPEPVKQCRVDLGPVLPTYDISVSAKVLARAKGRLKPRMGVGIFGEYGFTLRLAPARKRLELVQYGEVIAEVPCRWRSAQWHHIELVMKPHQSFWQLTGRVWASGQTRPVKPQLSYKSYPSSQIHQLSGKAFLTGAPFNGLPIFYDEILVRKNPDTQ